MRVKMQTVFITVLSLLYPSNASVERSTDGTDNVKDNTRRRLGDYYAGGRPRPSKSNTSRGKGGGKGRGFLSEGFFSYSEHFSLKDDSEESTATTTSESNESSNNGSGYLASYETYRGTFGGGLTGAFSGGFPIRCVPRQQGLNKSTTKGIVKKGRRVAKGKKGAKQTNGGYSYPGVYNKYSGKGSYKTKKDYGASYQSKGISKSSKSKSKSKGKGRYQSGRSKASVRGGKGSRTSQYSHGRQGNSGSKYKSDQRTGGFLQRGRYFHAINRLVPIKRPSVATQYFIRRSDALLYECYFGAFPSFSGIPAFPEKPPSVAPVQGPTLTPSFSPTQGTASPTVATESPTTAPTIPTETPTAAPTAATTSPTVATALPTALTTSPTIVTASPTAMTATPTIATASPTAMTASPTMATASPTATTASPTMVTASPTAMTASPTMVTASPTAMTASPTVATAAPTSTPTISPTIATAAPTSSPTVAPTLSTASPTSTPTIDPTNATVAPTSTPTLAPTNSTSAPTPAATLAGDNPRQTLLSMLKYGFFEEAENRAPTEEELAGLITNTEAFYSTLFMAEYGGDFLMFDFVLNNSTYNTTQGAELPLLLDFDAVVTFSKNISLPGPRDLSTIMQATPELYMTYIMEFVWQVPPAGSLFSETEQVIFTVKGGQF